MTDSHKPPRLALAADVLALGLFAAGTYALSHSDLMFRLLGLRVSIRSAWRPYAIAFVVLAIRNALVRRPPSFAWVLARLPRLSLARLAQEAAAPLPLEEQALFGGPASWPARLREFALLLAGFSVLIAALTWPHIRRL